MAGTITNDDTLLSGSSVQWNTNDSWPDYESRKSVSTESGQAQCADRQLNQSLSLRALERALTLRRPRPGLIHHSDRGVQYVSAAYQARLHAHGIVPSMSRVGDCWDNAVVESFFATLKRELVQHAHWPTRAEAHRALVAFIDGWYNHQRRHSALGFVGQVQKSV